LDAAGIAEEFYKELNKIYIFTETGGGVIIA